MPLAHHRTQLDLCKTLLVSGCSLLALSLGAGQAMAQDEETAVEDLIVVIGTPGGAGVRRQEASFAITSIEPEEITKFAPKSTADLLKAIPGVWAESSGGVAGANIDVRGLPGGSDAPFVTMAINGSPIYGTEMLSFFEQSSMFRIDETIAGVEGLRGGPNAVFGKGEPGLTVNYNLKEGGEETEGLVKYTTSDYGLQRVDAVMSGKLAEDLYYMVGGYFRSSDGIRDTQFKSEEGHQFTVNLTKLLDRGKVNIFLRETDDHGQWILPMALNTGNDRGEFAQLGNATRFRELQVNANGDTEIFDFAEGRGWDGIVTGGSFEFDLGSGFTLRDRLTYTNGDANTFGFVPSGSPVTVADVTAVTGNPVVTEGGVTLAGTEFVQTYGHWVVKKDLEAIINDLSINKEFETGGLGVHDVTVGYYQATWSADDFWTIGNPIPVHNVANGDSLDLTTVTPADIAAAGGDAGFLFGIESAGDARADALYFADSWQVTDLFRLDGGVRHEWINLDYVLDTGPGFPDGVRDLNADLDDNKVAYTIAGNYDLADGLGVFTRYSKGFLFPHFDDIRENNLNVNGVKQLEGGVKFQSDYFDLYGTFYYTKNNDFLSVVGSSVAAEAFKTRSIGVEVEGDVHYGPFSTRVTATIQDAEIRNSSTASNIGNQVLRQPDWQVRFSPAIDFDFGYDLQATLYGAVSLVGERFGDNANTVVLPSYEKVDLGVLVDTPNGLYFQAHADNLNDSHGITEGDPRNPAAPNGRPILGRSFRFSVGFRF
ncbi:MAG: TonB-dependent receptor [Parvularculaceae bacterium]